MLASAGGEAVLFGLIACVCMLARRCCGGGSSAGPSLSLTKHNRPVRLANKEDGVILYTFYFSIFTLGAPRQQGGRRRPRDYLLSREPRGPPPIIYYRVQRIRVARATGPRGFKVGLGSKPVDGRGRVGATWLDAGACTWQGGSSA